MKTNLEWQQLAVKKLTDAQAAGLTSACVISSAVSWDYAALELGGEIISESDNLGGKLQSSVTYAKGTSQRKQRILPNELHSLVGKYTGGGMIRIL